MSVVWNKRELFDICYLNLNDHGLNYHCKYFFILLMKMVNKKIWNIFSKWKIFFRNSSSCPPNTNWQDLRRFAMGRLQDFLHSRHRRSGRQGSGPRGPSSCSHTSCQKLRERNGASTRHQHSSFVSSPANTEFCRRLFGELLTY